MRTQELVWQYLNRCMNDSALLQNGGRLPSVRQIAGELKISAPTVYSVFRRLKQAGRIRTEAGSGTFMMPSLPQRAGGLKIAISIRSLDIIHTESWEGRITLGIMHAAARSRQIVYLCPMDGDQASRPELQRKLLAEKSNFDGLILFPMLDNEELRASYERDGKSVVCVNPPREDSTCDFVSPNYFAACCRLGHAWGAAGRRRVLGVFAPSVSRSTSARLRLAGLYQGLHVGMADAPAFRLVESADVKEEVADSHMRELLEREGWWPDAVYCSRDYMALAAVRALREHGLNVPRDVSVVGGAGCVLSTVAELVLTCPMQPLEELGEALLMMLCQRMEQNGASLPGRYLPMEFECGGTTREDENSLFKDGRMD